ncbi:TetR/AcrR family transcriptional regulator [Cellulosimicrobium cellulans]|uniref:TetR/AcrR family transcriptional regulator n=1 Tax=Cellulosimicrobium cellulans TaxID=1710 RepID=UPI0036E1ACBA
MDVVSGQGRRSLAERRQQLLDAAIEVMSERGIGGATTRAITDAAGVPQGIFHYCFDSKGALLQALLERESERAMGPAWRADPTSESFSEALGAAVAAQLQRVRSEPRHFLVLAELTVLARTDTTLTPIAKADRVRAVEQVAAVLARWRPDLSATEQRTWAVVVLAGIEGLTEAWLTDRDDDGLEEAARHLVKAILAGMDSTA